MKKDRIRKEYKRQLDNKIAWNIINKYKISFEKNSNKLHIAIIITNNYKGFLNELKSNGYFSLKSDFVCPSKS